MDSRRWGVILVVAVLCAGMGAWYILRGGSVEAPASPEATAPTAQPPAPLDLAPPLPEITTAAVPAAAAPATVNPPAIRGRVVDSRNRPIADAAVAVYEPNTGARRAFTDASGAFAVGDLKASEYRVSAQKDHYNEAVEERVRPEAAEMVLVLTDMSHASGRVLDEAGKPVPEFEVVYLQTPPSNLGLWREICRSERTPWQGFSDPEGRFRVDDIASGAAFALGARAKGFEPAYATAPAVEPGAEAPPVEIRLSAEARVAGTVLSADRQPVANAVIYLGKDAEAPAVAESDVDGRFELTGLGEEPLELTAAHPDHLPGSAKAAPRRGETVSVEVVMGLGGSIEGTVYKGDQPAAGQSVTVSRLAPPRIRKQTTTGPDGRYSVAGIGLGTVDVLAKFLEPVPDAVPQRLHRQAEIEAGQVTVVDFHFPAALATVEGTVTLGGQRIEGAKIRGTVTNDEGQSYFSSRSGDDGSFRASSVVPGSAWLEVTVLTDAGSELRKNVTVEIPEGGTVRQDVDFEISTGIVGTVTNLRPGDVGQVMALAGHVAVDTSSVEALMELERVQSGQSDIDRGGAYEIQGLDPGPYTVVALVFSGEADTGDDALSSLRVDTRTITVPASGQVLLDIPLR